MPRPRNHDDQPRCDECGQYGEWHDGEQAYLCEWCEPEPDEVDLGELDQLEVQSMTESLWQKPSRGWPTPQDPTRIEARFKNGSVVVGSIYWDVTDDGYPTFSFELDDNTFGDISQVVEYRELPI